MDAQHNLDNREWTVLCHNIIGIKFDRKWNSIINKIQEIGGDIICLQETKREIFDHDYLRNFTPRSFDNFYFVPSVGNSGGTLISWKGSKFQGQVIFENEFA
jgi:exonuclease III